MNQGSITLVQFVTLVQCQIGYLSMNCPHYEKVKLKKTR